MTEACLRFHEKLNEKMFLNESWVLKEGRETKYSNKEKAGRAK
jgi:hypothetical protein